MIRSNVVQSLKTIGRVLGSVRAFPWLAFDWSLKQRRFLDSKAKRLCLRAATQIGKTLIAAAKALDFVTSHKNVTVLVLCASNWSRDEVVGKRLDELAPRHMIVDGCEYNEKRGWRNQVILFTNGSKIVFRSAENPKQISISGISVDALWVDEPPAQHLWTEALQRIARSRDRVTPDGRGYGFVWLTFTPTGRETKWLRTIIEGDDTTDPPTPPKGEWEQIVIQLTREDCPYMSQEAIDEQVADIDAWQIPARVFADWEGDTPNRAFDGFGPQCLIDRIPYAQDYTTHSGWDHGELAGHEVAVIPVVSKSKGRIYILDEYVSTTATDPEQDAEGFIKVLRRHNLSPASLARSVGDTNAAGKGHVGRKVNGLLMEHLTPMQIDGAIKGSGSVDWGRRLINIALRRGHLIIHERCKNLIRALKHWTGKDDDLKHIIDALRYILVPLLEEMYGRDEISRIRLGRW